ETINIELEHRVTKLIAENEHLKQTYKQLYDSIKPSRVRAKEHADSLVNQLNQKSVEITDLNVKLQEKLDPVTLDPKDKNNRETHIYYLKHTMEQAAILMEIVEQAKSLNPLDSASYSTCKYVKLIQELLGYVRDTCPDIYKPSEKLVAVTPINKKKIVKFAEPVISSRVGQSTKSSRSKSTDNTKNDRILCSKYMTGDRFQLTNFVHKFLGTVKFVNDQIAKIVGYGDYQIGNITILRVYYVEGLGHNLFSVGQFCDSDLEVAFRKHTCFVCNLEGVDLLSISQETNLYTLSIGDMMASSPICLFSKASKTKSWLWH
ncbi:hypothetical protein Tco_0867177, partial [Tanacetum coccineum]